METQSTFRIWFFEKYLDYQRNEKYPRSIGDFSDSINLDRGLVSMLLWGKREPSKRVLELLSSIYGDEALKYQDIQTVKAVQKKVKKLLSKLSPDEQQTIISNMSFSKDSNLKR